MITPTRSQTRTHWSPVMSSACARLVTPDLRTRCLLADRCEHSTPLGIPSHVGDTFSRPARPCGMPCVITNPIAAYRLCPTPHAWLSHPV
jgi:hypothetical protein